MCIWEMKALILVGGYGTRLRPLTFSRPKPCVEFANKPIVCHQIEALAKAGVTEVVLAISYQPEAMRENIQEWERTYGVRITCSVETESMGTAGPLALAREILTRDNADGSFFVLNSDIICEYPFEEMIKYHQSHGSEGTLAVYAVDDPSKYGVIVSNEEHQILSFVEKPAKFISNKINCGLYLLSVRTLDRISLRPTSIEREIFPAMAQDRALHTFVLKGFWMDIGQPKDFLEGTKLYLASQEVLHPERLARGEGIRGNVLIDPTATIEPGSLIGPNVTIGPRCHVKAGARLINSAVLEGSFLDAHSWVKNSIIGWKCHIGKWARLEGLCVLGEDVRIADEICLNATIVLPHKELKESVLEAKQIIM